MDNNNYKFNININISMNKTKTHKTQTLLLSLSSLTISVVPVDLPGEEHASAAVVGLHSHPRAQRAGGQRHRGHEQFDQIQRHFVLLLAVVVGYVEGACATEIKQLLHVHEHHHQTTSIPLPWSLLILPGKYVPLL